MKLSKLLLILTLLLSACSFKNYKHEESKIIIIKTPKLRFSDLGYIRHTGDDVEMELFMAGVSVQTLSINHLICVDEGCMLRSRFNKEYLNAKYPSDILQNILLSKVIYHGKNRVQIPEGFEQIIQTQNVDIKYRVTKNETFFKDRKNRIMFKIKDIK
jgi:hypothetical protein